MQVVVQASSSHRWLSSKWVWQILAGGLTPPTCALYCVICLDAMWIVMWFHPRLWIVMWFYLRCELWCDSFQDVNCDAIICLLMWFALYCVFPPDSMLIVSQFNAIYELWWDFIQLWCLAILYLFMFNMCWLVYLPKIWLFLLSLKSTLLCDVTENDLSRLNHCWMIWSDDSDKTIMCTIMGSNGDDPWQCNVTYRIWDLRGENVAHTQKILWILKVHILQSTQSAAHTLWFMHTEYTYMQKTVVAHTQNVTSTQNGENHCIHDMPGK